MLTDEEIVSRVINGEKAFVRTPDAQIQSSFIQDMFFYRE